MLTFEKGKYFLAPTEIQTTIPTADLLINTSTTEYAITIAFLANELHCLFYKRLMYMGSLHVYLITSIYKIKYQT